MKVSIIIPVHNQYDLLERCIESIYVKTKTDFYITVINDGSDELTAKGCGQLLNKGRIHKLISNPVATGFTYSCNEGVVYSPICDYYCFLNSDTIIAIDNWVEKIISLGESDANIGCIGVLSNNASMQSVGKEFIQDNEIEEYGNWIVSLSDNLFPETTFINGFCFFVKSNVVEQVGLFDYDAFPHYGSEDDYTLRIREKKYKLVIADNVYVYHYSNQSYKSKRNDLVKVSFPNLLKKWGSERVIKDSIFSEKVLDYLRVKIKNCNSTA